MKSCQNQPVHFVASALFPENNLHYFQTLDSCSITWIIDEDTIAQPVGVPYLNHTFSGPSQHLVSMYIVDSHLCPSSVSSKIRINSSANPIIAINPPDSMCLGATQILSIGKSDTSNIILSNIAIFGEDTLVFIPDGDNCPGLTPCLNLNIHVIEPFSYVLTSASMIESVCVKMEHSYLGDLQFRLICPNNQSVILHSQPNGGGLFLGVPIDDQGGCNPVDSLAGIGWNYCWSVDPAHNYHGASPNYIHQGQTTTNCDSTDVAHNLNYYHPMNTFQGLVGCPLFGVWSIEICDMYQIDDGWVFNWSLTISNAQNQPSSWNYPLGIQNVNWTGPNIVNTINHNIEVSPTTSGINNYHVSIIDSIGCQYDTTLSLFVIGYPVASFSYYTDLGGVTYFANQSQNANTYLWDFGYNSATAITEFPIFSYPSDGNYTVVLNASNTRCPQLFDDTTQIISWTNVGIDEQNEQKIITYPNPSNGVLNVEFASALNVSSELTIVDINGKIVYTAPISSTDHLIQLHLNSLATGVYNLRIKNATQAMSKVFIIER